MTSTDWILGILTTLALIGVVGVGVRWALLKAVAGAVPRERPAVGSGTGHPGAVPALRMTMVPPAPPDPRAGLDRSVRALIDNSDVSALVDVLASHAEPRVRADAAIALGLLGSPLGLHGLKAALADDGEITDTKHVTNWAVEGDPQEEVRVVVYRVRDKASEALARLKATAR
jgi:hypothetical protein